MIKTKRKLQRRLCTIDVSFADYLSIVVKCAPMPKNVPKVWVRAFSRALDSFGRCAISVPSLPRIPSKFCVPFPMYIL